MTAPLLSPAAIAELERLEGEATKGPWRVDPKDDDIVCDEPRDGFYTATVTVFGGCPVGYDNSSLMADDTDREFIVALRNAAPSLLTAARLLGELVDALPKCNGRWTSGSGGHARFSVDCGKPATYCEAQDSWQFCDECLPRLPDGSIHRSAPCEADYAPILRRIRPTESGEGGE